MTKMGGLRDGLMNWLIGMISNELAELTSEPSGCSQLGTNHRKWDDITGNLPGIEHSSISDCPNRCSQSKMKLSAVAVLGLFVTLICNKNAGGNILHDIKEIIKDIFAGNEDGDTKEIERVRKTMAEFKSCLGVQLDKTELESINKDCDEEFDITEEHDKKKKQRVQLSACYRVCQIEQLGWLHDTDSEHTSGPYFNHTAMEGFVVATFPASIQKKLKEKISTCARNVESFSDEKACKNYKVFFKCLDKSIHDKCKKKRGGSRGGGGGDAETTTEKSEDEEDEETTTSGSEDEDE